MKNKMKYTGVFLVFVILVVGVFASPTFAKGTHNRGQPFEELWDAIDSLWDAIDEIELTSGPPGPQGEQGPVGPKGDTGDTGPHGPPGEMPEFGDYQTKSANTIYTANTDGIVVAQMHISTDDKYGYISGKTGNTSQPATSWTIRATDAIWNNSWASITMPVREGDMWCVNTSSEAPSYTDNVSWMPVGN